jgi:hypothetical protein
VPARTLESLVVEQCRAVVRASPLSFCETLDCPVVYFDADNRVVRKPAVRVKVFQKEHDEARPVCYCFGHSVADVLAAHQDDGSNPIVDEITDACRRRLDRCEETNPQGRCCLGNVRGLVRGGTAPAGCGECS